MKKRILRSHYDQMQMQMAVMNLSWCDYLVFCIPDNFVYLERIQFDQEYWAKYPDVKAAMDRELFKPPVITTPQP